MVREAPFLPLLEADRPSLAARHDGRRCRVGPGNFTLSPSQIPDVNLGAAWKKTTSQGGKPYVSVRLDSPFLLQPVNCALFAKQDGSEHYLVWAREKPANGGH